MGEQFAPENSENVPGQELAQGLAGSMVETSTVEQGSVEEPATPGSGQPETSDGWLTSVQSLLITVVIAVFVIMFVVQAFQIPSESMEDTLLIGDYLLVDKAHFGPAGPWSWLIPYQKIRHGDIVVFRYPVDPKQHFVKRVIGTPGDHIRMVNKRVFVNGHVLDEPYAIHRFSNYDSFRDNFPNGDIGLAHLPGKWSQELQRLTEDGQLIVPDGFYFVMGDNRDDSSDSRYWGFVPRENIIGRPLLIYWSVRNSDLGDTPDDKALAGGKLTRFAVALKQGWADLRWRRVLTLVR